jgi:predicted HicB family RNase H-like nuclease
VKNKFDHMGFKGTKEYHKEDKIWFGYIRNVKDVVSYQADYEEELYDVFVDTVNDYIDLCNRIGKEIPWKE